MWSATPFEYNSGGETSAPTPHPNQFKKIFFYQLLASATICQEWVFGGRGRPGGDFRGSIPLCSPAIGFSFVVTFCFWISAAFHTAFAHYFLLGNGALDLSVRWRFFANRERSDPLPSYEHDSLVIRHCSSIASVCGLQEGRNLIMHGSLVYTYSQSGTNSFLSNQD